MERIFFLSTLKHKGKKYRKKKCKLSKVAMTSSLQRTFEKASYELEEKLIKHVFRLGYRVYRKYL